MSVRGIDPGERPFMVRLEQRSATDEVDDSGAPTETWTTLVAAMPASKDNLSARETFAADQLSATADTRFVINYRLDMDPELLDVPKLRRVVHRDRVYDIVAADMLGYRAAIELTTLAKVG